MNYYIEVLKKYTVFDGRAGRREFWMFTLISFIISLILGMLDGKQNILSSVYSLAVLLPSVGVSIRRLHDIGKSGWWMFIALIPIVGWIWVIVLYARASNLGDNKYGPNPKVTTPATQI